MRPNAILSGRYTESSESFCLMTGSSGLNCYWAADVGESQAAEAVHGTARRLTANATCRSMPSAASLDAARRRRVRRARRRQPRLVEVGPEADAGVRPIAEWL